MQRNTKWQQGNEQPRNVNIDDIKERDWKIQKLEVAQVIIAKNTAVIKK